MRRSIQIFLFTSIVLVSCSRTVWISKDFESVKPMLCNKVTAKV